MPDAVMNHVKRHLERWCSNGTSGGDMGVPDAVMNIENGIWNGGVAMKFER